MDKKTIVDNFNKFNIPLDKLPHYENPKQFASQFKRCSLRQYENISYSNSASLANSINSAKDLDA